MKVYKSSGIVLGHFWGGGSGGYVATKLEAKNKKELLKLNQKALDSGSLDSGMGFESLIGAIICITTVHTKTIKSKQFTNNESEIEFIGKLTEEQEDFLEQCYFNSPLTV